MGAEDDGFQGGGADFVYGGADGSVGHAGADGALPGGVLAETGEDESVGGLWEGRGVVLCGEDIAEENFLDFRGFDAGDSF